MDTLLYEYHTAHDRFDKLMIELSKYRTKLRSGEDVAAFDNIIQNCRSNLQQMVASAKNTETEFLEFKLRTLKELESVKCSETVTAKVKWMESPFDVYSISK